MKKSMSSIILVLGLASVIGQACHDGGGEVPNQTSPGKSNQTGGLAEPGTDPYLEVAVADLATRLAIPEDRIRVLDQSPVHWRSGALGCPKEGMNYTMVIVPGYLIVLQAGKDRYRYHGRQGSEPAFCPDARAEEPVNAPSLNMQQGKK